jgi:hypothetical protein
VDDRVVDGDIDALDVDPPSGGPPPARIQSAIGGEAGDAHYRQSNEPGR